MITLCDLTAGYGKATILHGINACFETGKITGILGPNGSGKSTLLKAVLGSIPSARGKIFLDGCDLHALSPKERARKMAFLPQQRSMPEMTVEELAAHGRYAHLGHGRILSPQDHQAIDRALALAGAREYRHELLSRLSGGQQQRAYLSQLLSQDSSHLLLDEPINHLDPAGQLEWMELLKALAQGGRSIVIVLHDLPLAMQYCDELIVLEKGRIKAKGAPQALLEEKIPEQVFKVRLLPAEDGCYAVKLL